MDASKIQACYTWHTQVASYDVGPERLITPSALLRLQQEAGEKHFQEGGLGWRGMADLGMAFVVSRSCGRIHRMPAMGEPIRIQTWHRNAHGARLYRCYRILDESGQPLVDSIGMFALVDVCSHKLMRADAFSALGVEQQQQRVCNCPEPPKITPPTLQPAGTHTVRWSQTDFNGHFNNTCYADLLCDYAPYGMAQPITGFALNYHHEVKAGDMLALQAGSEGASDYVRGYVGDSLCFDGVLWRD